MLTTAALIPTGATAQRPPAASRDAQRVADGPRQAEPVFAGVSCWPDVDRILAAKSLAFISRRGVGDFVLAGGALRPDGHPTFASPSEVGYGAVRHVIDSHDGFRYTDEAGVQWAVLIQPKATGNLAAWHGVAIGIDFPADLLEPPRRRACLHELTTRLRELTQPGHSFAVEALHERARLSRIHRRLQLIDAAVKTIPVLYAAVQAGGRHTVCVDTRRLAAAAWGQKTNWPANSGETIFDAITMLGTIRTQSINFPKTGWDPQPQKRQVAVLGARWRDPQTLSVQVAPDFITFVSHWLASSKSVSSQLKSWPAGDVQTAQGGK